VDGSGIHHYVGSVPAERERRRSAFEAIDDPATLRRLLEASLLLESNLELSALLNHIVEEARSLADARYGALGVLDSSGTKTIDFIVSGLSPAMRADLADTPLPTGKGVLGVLMDDPLPTRIRVIGEHPASVGFPPHHPPMTSFLGIPIRVRGRAYGNLYLTDKIGADEFTIDDELVINALAVAAGIAIDNSRLNQRAGEVAVYEERDRLARDLHDGVIQRLFAIGLTLQGLVTTQAGRAIATNMAGLVDEIDGTIQQVRSTIFELSDQMDGSGVRSAVAALVSELRPMLGFDVPVEFTGAIDSTVSDEVAAHLLAVMREALTNVSRHAQATRAWVRIDLVGSDVRLEVADDGTGFVDGPHAGRGFGLENMEARAEELGGSLEVHHPASGGTIIWWQVPASINSGPGGR